MRRLVASSFLALGILATAPLWAQENVQADLEAVVRKRVASLSEQKNADGVAYRRGSYSKNMRKADESTYLATIHQDTAEGDKLTTERIQLTLKKGADGKWAISKEDVVDKFAPLMRYVPGDEKFFRFKTLSLEREGLKLTATNGTLFQDFFNGKPQILKIAAADLAYAYDPPKGAVHPTHAFYYYKSEYPTDLVFKPHHAVVYGDGVSVEEILGSSFQGLEPIGATEAGPVLQALHQEVLAMHRGKTKESAFAGFQEIDYPDHRAWTVAINGGGSDDMDIFAYQMGDKSVGVYGLNFMADRNVALSYDSWKTREVGFYATKLESAATYYAPLMTYNAEASRSAKSPLELESRPDGLERFYDVESLTGTLELALEDPERMDGDVTFVLNVREDMETVPFVIVDVTVGGGQANQGKPKLFVNSITDGSGNELTCARTSSISGIVKLPQKIKAGSTLTLRMQFANLGAIRKENPSFSQLARGGWLPFVRFGDMINGMDLTVKVPSKYKTLGIGKKVSETKAGGVSTTRWLGESPVVFPTIIFGEYIEDTSDYVAKKMDGTPIPVTVNVDKVSTNQLDVDITTGEQAQKFSEEFSSGARGIRGKQLKPIATQAAAALDLYKELFGVDYPYAKLDLVNDPAPALYGQAPSSIIYLGSLVFRGTGTMSGSDLFGGGNATGTSKFLKSVVAHEVGHQWWGSVVANRNSANYWFIETLAEYASAIYLERAFGRKEYLEQVEEWRAAVLRRDYTIGVQEAPIVASPDPGNYQAAVYNRGPLAFHILRTTFGDEKFFAFFKKLAQSLAHKEISTRDIQLVSEEAFGSPGKPADMEWFWDQWIRGAGIPEYSFNYTSRKTEDGKFMVEGTIKQRVVVGRKKFPIQGVTYRGVVPVTVIGKGGKEYPARVLVQGADTPFKFKVPEEPMDVKFNKDNDIFAQDVLVNRGF